MRNNTSARKSNLPEYRHVHCGCSGDDCLNPFTTAVSSEEDSDKDISSDREDAEET